MEKQSSKPIKETNKGPKESPKAGEKGESQMIAVVLVRGLIDITKDIKDTLYMLRLRRRNYCVVLEKTPSNLGMVKKAKDYVTWGEIDDETLKMLIEKRAERNPEDPKRTKPYFRLNPPRKGYGRKGVKSSFSIGGALGYRGKNINDLVKRML